ncbi:DNA (cytosine-5-)-methyltransferase [Paracoccus sp. YIM 132242]|uniref:DNA (cytosine-5-)-methyltransferase n=1 Tax=Paracoccus lichenicola TaxID=2665644 RepID=A0A6L6HSE5_9RHOB|nr:DNA cytosine methyltransferase [Paracoccus lichenicola]MTE02126.1 DNA (cytosine-5-)-methyltransferase [Paracoccus lichenicola]
MRSFYEFFAGGGMARAGLGSGWQCMFANDFDLKKGVVYRRNWGDDELRTGDIRAIMPSDLPGMADLAWASFPCQDLSLAGGGAGLKGERSGTFWPFWDLMSSLNAEKRGPRMIVLENVCGTLSSHSGKDFVAIGGALRKQGYRFGALVVDAALFLPQSRPRLFVVGVRDDVAVPPELLAEKAQDPWHTKQLRAAYEKLPAAAKAKWLWWRLPKPPQRSASLADLIEKEPTGVEWHSPAETEKLLGMMSAINLAKVEKAKLAGRVMVGGVYKRTRPNEDGVKVQRAEIRFDDISGCLRTPAGGSSRQVIVVVDGDQVRSRLISTRETARLMGLPDSYHLPPSYNEAYHLTGDGVAVPVVRHLAHHLFEPILGSNNRVREAA